MSSSLDRIREDCPLDKDQLGYQTWGLLHTIAAYYPEKPTADEEREMKTFFMLLGKFYPCESCARDFSSLLKLRPPATSSQRALAGWLCWVHNHINQKLGKPQFDCSRLDERWRDGWDDGSCD
ncbi:FAD-linked sulfhydryl oxidase ALR-like [Diaphorina citri]|uniref:Sulfhydryl oxidase n=1 Tax=Diaphorina citri TaxID=121845 RepID=A0A1S3DLM9_DIACI|nr:FAD-linked sulfhydryl oxidase ALR-like [Diaphorina citri]KAI5709834.1 hypothetical protein M8J75_003605 [Diaphorina citri]KAI5745030.1 hypothetical protein M8J76_007527 [Diaphorina citri]KAI5753096.1 hypothetical protein M8J77_023442 [Diaphorina citri]